MLYGNFDPGLNFGYGTIGNGLLKTWNQSNDSVFTGITDQAKRYADPANAAQMRGQAMSDVAQQVNKAQGEASRNLTRMGVNPSSGAYAKMQTGLGLSSALGQAQAANTAQRDWEKNSWGMGLDAAKLMGDQSRNNTAILTTGANLALGLDKMNIDWLDKSADRQMQREKFDWDKQAAMWNRDNLTANQKALLESRMQQDPSIAQQVQSWAAAGKGAFEIFNLVGKMFPSGKSTGTSTYGPSNMSNDELDGWINGGGYAPTTRPNPSTNDDQFGPEFKWDNGTNWWE